MRRGLRDFRVGLRVPKDELLLPMRKPTVLYGTYSVALMPLAQDGLVVAAAVLHFAVHYGEVHIHVLGRCDTLALGLSLLWLLCNRVRLDGRDWLFFLLVLLLLLD